MPSFTPAPGGGSSSSGPTLLAVTADQAITASTTLTDMTGMGLPIGASATEVWVVSYWLLFTGANTTHDLKHKFSVPAGCTIKWGQQDGVNGWLIAGAAGSPGNMYSEGDQRAAGSAANTFGMNITAIIFGGGTAGTVNFQFAQNTSDAGALTVKRGSCAVAHKVTA